MLLVTLAGTYRRLNNHATALPEADNRYFVVLKHEATEHRLEIPTGMNEARNIAYAMNDTTTLTPTTTALIAEVLDKAGLRLSSVQITSVEQITDMDQLIQLSPSDGYLFRATITVSDGNQTKDIYARVTDALGLALQIGCGIYVSEEVMAKLGQPTTIGSRQQKYDVVQGVAPEETALPIGAINNRQTTTARCIDRGILLVVALLCVALYVGGLWLTMSWHLRNIVFATMPIVTVLVFYISLMHGLRRSRKR